MTNQISLGYSAREDRLVLWIGTGEAATMLFLTRRLCTLLINGLVGVLARSSPIAAQAPAELRNDVVLMEHQGAMAASSVVPAVADQLPPISADASPPMLVETVNITTMPNDFRLVFRPSPQGDGQEITLSRADLHRVLEMLKRQSELAQWSLPVESGWLSASEQVTVN